MSRTLDLLQAQGKVAARYDFKRGSLLDFSGNGNTLVATNSPSWSNTRRGRALKVTAGTAKVAAPDAASLRINKGIILVFGDFQNHTAQQRILQLVNTASTGVAFYNSSATAIAIYDGSLASTLAASLINTKMVGVRFQDKLYPQFFINGVSVGFGNNILNIATPDAGVTVGSGPMAASAFANPITDAIVINDTSVTDEQISDIHNELMAERGYGNPVTSNFHYQTQPDASAIPPDGADLMVDGDMSAPTAAAYSAYQVVLSKDPTVTHLGTQTLKLAFDGTNAAGTAYQAVLPLGKKYRVTGYFKSDGVSVPRVLFGVAQAWDGSTSTSWQKFELVLAPATDTLLRLSAINLAAGVAGWYAHVTVRETFEYVTDPNMESEGITTVWNVGGGASVTKDTSTFVEGTQSIKVTGNQYCYASQGLMVVGKRYVVSGYCRGDGSSGVPCIKDNGAGAAWFVGTTSTAWQYFEKTITATGATYVLYQWGAPSGSVWFDKVSVKEPKCLLHWCMCQKTGDGKMLDGSGNGFHGTPSRANKAYIAPFDCLQFNQADASNVSLAAGFTNTISGNDRHAVSFWINFASVANSPVVFGNQSQYYHEINNAFAYLIYIGGLTRAYYLTPPSLNSWNHVYFEKTGAGDNCNLYLNNVLLTPNTGTVGDTPAGAALTLQVGSYAGGSGFGTLGGMADLRLYSSNLTAAERTKIYEEGAKRLTRSILGKGTASTLANVTAGQISNTPFSALSGSFSVTDSAGKSFLTGVSAGIASGGVSKQAYGTWAFKMYTGGIIDFQMASEKNGYYTDAGNTGYFFEYYNLGVILYKSAGGGGYTKLMEATNFLASNTEYDVCITRSYKGSWSLYVKGGAFPVWTLVTPTFGTNPVIDNAYTTSKYLVEYLGAGAKVGEHRFFQGDLDPRVYPSLFA